MNIIREDQDKLNVTLRVEITPTDYAEAVNKALRDYQKKAVMHGFRPGKVPIGIVRKLYGHAVTADEVNKIVSEGLSRYISENRLSILGYPIPDDEQNGVIDWNDESDKTLHFKVGLAPDFELNLTDGINIDYYEIEPSDAAVDEEINRLRDQNGHIESRDESGENDWIDIELVQLEGDGSDKPNGIKADTFLKVSGITDPQHRKGFVGLKKHDVITINLREIWPENKDVARLLRITESKAAGVEGLFRLTVKEVSQWVPAEINEEFFEKVFPGHGSMDQDHFRAHIRERIQRSMAGESDKLFLNDAYEVLIQANAIDLPEAFLKKWMTENKRNPHTADEIDVEYPKLAQHLKWDLIQEKIKEKFNIEPTDEDIKNYVRDYFLHRYGHRIERAESEVEDVVNRFMSKEEEVKKLRDEIFEKRLTETLKTNLPVNFRKVSFNEFVDIATSRKSNN